ncbi:ArsR family transcriptional regulator [Arthrobacter silviterrae]
MSRILFTSISARLLHLLSAAGPMGMPEICAALDLKPGRVRHKLWVLRRDGYVSITDPSAAGVHPCYMADRSRVERGLSELLADFGAEPP